VQRLFALRRTAGTHLELEEVDPDQQRIAIARRRRA
jgi:hypothetical protein